MSDAPSVVGSSTAANLNYAEESFSTLRHTASGNISSMESRNSNLFNALRSSNATPSSPAIVNNNNIPFFNKNVMIPESTLDLFSGVSICSKSRNQDLHETE